VGPVCDVGIVAGVLDDYGLGPGAAHLAPLDGEFDPPLLAFFGELYVHAGLGLTAGKSLGGGLGSCGGAGAGGPAGPELLALDLRHARGHGGLRDAARGHGGFQASWLALRNMCEKAGL
jgi:hypothetical protein